MASKFGDLKQYAIGKDTLARYTLHQIEVNGKSPTLIVGPATEANPSYFNALLKRSARSARQIAAGKVNAGMIAENREEDRNLYPLHILRGWEDMVDAKGKDIEFTREDAVEFIGELPDWVFDDIRNFCGRPDNFVRDGISNLDVEETGKN